MESSVRRNHRLGDRPTGQDAGDRLVVEATKGYGVNGHQWSLEDLWEITDLTVKMTTWIQQVLGQRQGGTCKYTETYQSNHLLQVCI